EADGTYHLYPPPNYPRRSGRASCRRRATRQNGQRHRRAEGRAPPHLQVAMLIRSKMPQIMPFESAVSKIAIGTLVFGAVVLSISIAPDTRGFLGAALALIVTAIAVIDARYFIIPDSLVLAGLLVALANSAVEDPSNVPFALMLAGARGIILALIF